MYSVAGWLPNRVIFPKGIKLTVSLRPRFHRTSHPQIFLLATNSMRIKTTQVSIIDLQVVAVEEEEVAVVVAVAATIAEEEVTTILVRVRKLRTGLLDNRRKFKLNSLRRIF